MVRVRQCRQDPVEQVVEVAVGVLARLSFLVRFFRVPPKFETK